MCIFVYIDCREIANGVVVTDREGNQLGISKVSHLCLPCQ